MASVPYRHNFIGGEWRPARNGGRIPVLNPANEAVIGSIPASTAEDVNIAVEAAIAAFKSWGKLTGAQRAVYLRKISKKARHRLGLKLFGSHRQQDAYFGIIASLIDEY